MFAAAFARTTLLRDRGLRGDVNRSASHDCGTYGDVRRGRANMTVHRFYPALAAVVWAAAVLTGAAAATADTVGAVEAVKRNVYGKPPEADEAPKYIGNPVVYQETIKTLVDSAALIRFDDGSKL